MKRIVFTIFLLVISLGVANAGVSLKYRKSLVIRQALLANEDRKIYRVNSDSNYDRGVFRRPPGVRKNKLWKPQSLIYVKPGGLEAAQTNYLLAVDDKLNSIYLNGTFSFSGPAKSLIYLNGVGWGTENNNGDFIPLLINADYEDKNVPSYDIIWEKRTGFHGFGDRIYLDYRIKVPKNSQIKWGGSELGIQRQSFASSFSRNLPNVKNNSIYRWFRSGYFQCYKERLTLPPVLMKWKLPHARKIKAFSIFGNNDNLCFLKQDGRLMTYSITEASDLWQQQAAGPIIYFENNLFVVNENYSTINILDAANGKKTGAIGLPKHLPRDNNSFCLFSGKRKSFLLLIVPEQSSVICYEIIRRR